jgi:hypothetical protein
MEGSVPGRDIVTVGIASLVIVVVFVVGTQIQARGGHKDRGVH